MISVVVATFDDERRLTACLAPLVPAAMEGLVRELIVADGGSGDRTLEVADEAGAIIVTSIGGRRAQVEAGIARAKGPWLLLLEPAVRLEFGWEAAVLKHINGPGGPARFRLRRGEASGRGLLAALQPPKALACLVLKGGDFRQGSGVDGRVKGGPHHGIGDRHFRLLDASGWV